MAKKIMKDYERKCEKEKEEIEKLKMKKYIKNLKNMLINYNTV